MLEQTSEVKLFQILDDDDLPFFVEVIIRIIYSIFHFSGQVFDALKSLLFLYLPEMCFLNAPLSAVGSV